MRAGLPFNFRAAIRPSTYIEKIFKTCNFQYYGTICSVTTAVLNPFCFRRSSSRAPWWSYPIFLQRVRKYLFLRLPNPQMVSLQASLQVLHKAIVSPKLKEGLHPFITWLSIYIGTVIIFQIEGPLVFFRNAVCCGYIIIKEFFEEWWAVSVMTPSRSKSNASKSLLLMLNNSYSSSWSSSYSE